MKVFLSYTRNKDEFSVMSEVRRHLENQLKIRDPSSTVFQDTAYIEAGQVWPEVLNQELETADVLVPLLSPAYFQSSWCRDEYSWFKAKEEASGYVVPG